MKKTFILLIIFISILFSNKIFVKASVSNGLIVGSEVYETLNIDKEVSNGWGYDSTGNILILDNYNGGKIQIFVDYLNIKLIGHNFIDDVGVGIDSEANISIDGTDGTLDIHISGEGSCGISGKNIVISNGIYNFMVLGVGIFASENNIEVYDANFKIIANGMGFQALKDIMFYNSQVSVRTNYISFYSVYESIAITNSKIVSMSKYQVFYSNRIMVTDNSILALEGNNQAIKTNNFEIDGNLVIKGGNTKEEIVELSEITNHKYVYINREPNTSLPISLKIVKEGSKLILTWSNSLNFNILFENQIYEVLANVNRYELNISNPMDNYHLEIYSIDDDGIESYHLVKNIDADGNPDTKDHFLEDICIVMIYLCTLIYLSKKLIKKYKSFRN